MQGHWPGSSLSRAQAGTRGPNQNKLKRSAHDQLTGVVRVSRKPMEKWQTGVRNPPRRRGPVQLPPLAQRSRKAEPRETLSGGGGGGGGGEQQAQEGFPETQKALVFTPEESLCGWEICSSDKGIDLEEQTSIKLGLQPVPSAIYKEIKDLTQRTDCLDLKGEKLDYKACDALEEVFKRVQFKLVDLEQTNLDEDGASALFDMIEYYESATHLNVSFNKHIGTRGWQAAAHMMKKTNCLQYLDARNTPLLDHSAPFVARALRISSSLGVLHLENAGLSGRPLMLLATALKMNMNLRELYLADNKLNGLQDSAQLGNLLKFNCYIQILDLRNNYVLDSGLAYLCEGLKEQRKGLVTLVLWNNQLTHNGMAYLAAVLPCTQSLETVNLGHNSIGNEGVHKLKDGLIANRSVLRLGLASTKLSCEGAVAVAEFIAESPRLLRLDLRENEIKTGGLMALSLALKVNTSLLRLDLDREPKREAVKSFLETQRALLSEIQNGCKRNFILAKEKEETEQKMHQSASMPEITMALPQTEEGVAAEDSGQGEGGDERGGAGEPPSHKQEEENKAGATTSNNMEQESDSDTDDEVEGPAQAPVSVEKTSSAPPPPCHPVPTAAVVVEPPGGSGDAAPPSRLEDKPRPAITLSDPATTLGSPTQSNEKRISVTSPGRGHKIFVVTRVESPPEQPLQAVEKAQTTPLLSQPATPIPGKEDEQASLAVLASPLKSTVSDTPAPAVTDSPLPHLPSKAEVREGALCAAAAGGTLPNGFKAEFIRILPESCETPEPKGVKSFLETQRALLSEIQNGCKRNFILAKEKEETEQKMHQSASMPEITMALPQTEEGVAAEDSGQGEGGDERGGAGEPPSHKQEEENKAGATTSNNMEQESDSDTDDEVEGPAQAPVSVEKTSSAPPPPCHPVPTAAVVVEPPGGSGDAAPPSRLEDKPRPAITLSDPATTLGSPTQSNEKRISVTSPGRGHKIFVVTRVESPPEQPLQAVEKAQTTPLLSQPATPIPGKEDEQASLAVLASPLKSTVSDTPAPAVTDSPLPHLPSKAEVREGALCAAAAGGTLPNGFKAEFIRILPESCETPEPKGCQYSLQMPLHKFPPRVWEALKLKQGIYTRLPGHYLRSLQESRPPAAVHWKPLGVNSRVNPKTGHRERVQDVPIPVYYPPESQSGLWGGEGWIVGYRYANNDKLSNRLKKVWKPQLFNRELYSEILDHKFKITVTARTLDLVDAAYGFDFYILRPAVHWKPLGVNSRVNPKTGHRERMQDVPIPVYYPPESQSGLWGGEGWIVGYRYANNDKLSNRLKKVWKPQLFNRELYSEILDHKFKITVTARTLDLVDAAYGFDFYILRTPQEDLNSKLGMDLKRAMLLRLARKDTELYPENPAKRETVFNKYKEFVIPAEEAEWVGLSLEEAVEKQRLLEKEVRYT
ncbi:UNVERIFIED_CONTAM: hypothetical protein FKN15_041266 [Acipenser sinensis]